MYWYANLPSGLFIFDRKRIHYSHSIFDWSSDFRCLTSDILATSVIELNPMLSSITWFNNACLLQMPSIYWPYKLVKSIKRYQPRHLHWCSRPGYLSTSSKIALETSNDRKGKYGYLSSIQIESKPPWCEYDKDLFDKLIHINNIKYRFLTLKEKCGINPSISKSRHALILWIESLKRVSIVWILVWHSMRRIQKY